MAYSVGQQRDFRGGENLKILPELVAPNQCIRALNMVVKDSGALETRYGKVKINSTTFGTLPILGVWRWAKEDGSTFLTVQYNTSLYSAAWDGSSTISSFTEVKTGLTTDRLSGYVWKDNLILGNGVNTQFRFNGVSCANLGGTPPKMKVFTVYAGRIWGVDADNPSQIRFSGLEDYDSWDALDVVKVRDQDGDKIHGLHPIEGGLAIIKDTSVWPMYGSSKTDLRLGLTPLTDAVGCVSDEGSSQHGVFMGADNLYLFGLSAVTPAGGSHTPLIESLTASEREEVTVGVSQKDRTALFQLPNGYTIVADGKHDCVTTWYGLNASCIAVADSAGDDGRIIIGDADDGDLYMLSGSDDDGTAIQNKFKSGYYDGGTDQDKVFRKLEPDLTFISEGAYNITCGYDIDYKDKTGSKTVRVFAKTEDEWSDDSLDNILWGSQAEADIDYWFGNARGSRASFEVSFEGRGQIRGIKHLYKIVGDEKK